MSSYSDGKTVTRQTLTVMRQNGYMLWFPVVAMIVGVVGFFVIAAIGPLIVGISSTTSDISTAADGGDINTTQTVILVVFVVLGGYLATAVNAVCMGGLVHCADKELQGTDSSFGEGISAASSRLGPLLGWALIETIVGWILRAVSGNGGQGNAIVAIVRVVLASLLAMAWSLITFFVLPLIMLRNMGPVEAIKRSTQLLKETWGARLRGGMRIGGLIFLIILLPGLIALVVGIAVTVLGPTAIGIPVAAIGILVLIVASVLISALRTVFSVALLHYAEDGSAIGPYNEHELHSAIRAR